MTTEQQWKNSFVFIRSCVYWFLLFILQIGREQESVNRQSKHKFQEGLDWNKGKKL